MRTSGEQPVPLADEHRFVILSKRTNATASKAFARMMLAGQFEESRQVACQQAQNGPQVIDVNTHEEILDDQAAMVRFLNLVDSQREIASAAPTW